MGFSLRSSAKFNFGLHQIPQVFTSSLFSVSQNNGIFFMQVTRILQYIVNLHLLNTNYQICKRRTQEEEDRRL